MCHIYKSMMSEEVVVGYTRNDRVRYTPKFEMLEMFMFTKGREHQLTLPNSWGHVLVSHRTQANLSCCSLTVTGVFQYNP